MMPFGDWFKPSDPSGRPSDPSHLPSDPSCWLLDPLDRVRLDQPNKGWADRQMDRQADGQMDR